MWANLEGGDRHWGDILIGADGIWSKTRQQLVGPGLPSYSNYTCYTGIADYVCADIDTVGYRVFLGNKQYFVSSDVGGGKMQWYAFHKEEKDGKDEAGKSKARLMEIFGHWFASPHLSKTTPWSPYKRWKGHPAVGVFLVLFFLGGGCSAGVADGNVWSLVSR